MTSQQGLLNGRNVILAPLAIVLLEPLKRHLPNLPEDRSLDILSHKIQLGTISLYLLPSLLLQRVDLQNVFAYAGDRRLGGCYDEAEHGPHVLLCINQSHAFLQVCTGCCAITQIHCSVV